jgi:hypothetical protein
VALPALATASDLTRFGYPAIATTFLDRASVRVRAYTKQTLTRVVNDTVPNLRTVDGSVRLPQRPADKPTAVAVDNGLGLVTPIQAWGFNGRRVICPHILSREHWHRWDWSSTTAGWPGPWLAACLCVATTVTLTYSHGYTVIPDPVLDIVCSVAVRLAYTPMGMESGIRQESVGDYGVTYSVDSLDTASGLLPGEKASLDRILGRPRAGTIALS